MNWYDFLWGEGSNSKSLKLNHPKLGKMKYDNDEERWKGEIIIGENKIDFFVDGNEEKIDEDLADYCFDITSNFEFYSELAVQLIESELSISTTEAKFRFVPESLSSFWIDKNETMFYIWFNDNTNKYASWRVQFDNNIATHLGCDT